MANPDFYNDNSFRAYPLVGSPTVMMRYNGVVEVPAGPTPQLLELPPACIVDFACIVYPAAQYDDIQDRVYLHHAYRLSSSLIRFIFRSTCPLLANTELIFERTVNDKEYVTSYSAATLVAGETLSVHQETCGDEPLWEGYLVTGKMTDFATLLPLISDSLFFATDITPIVEPANVQNLANNYVRSVTVGNKARTVVDNPAGCAQVIDTPEGIYIHSSCITGDLQFKPGYNCSIRQDDQISTLTFSAGVGAGAGVPCEEIAIFEEEESPDGGQLLSGGPMCSEVLKSINGLTGEALAIVAGTGVRVLQVAEDQLTIDFDLHDLQACILADDPAQPPTSEGSWHEETFVLAPLVMTQRAAAWEVYQSNGVALPDSAGTPEVAAAAIATWSNSDGQYLQLDTGRSTEFTVALDPMPQPIYEVLSAQLQLKVRNTATFSPHEFSARLYTAVLLQQITQVKELSTFVSSSDSSVYEIGGSLGLIANSGYENWGEDPELPGVRVRLYANMTTPSGAGTQPADAGLQVHAMRLLVTCRVPD